MDSDSPISDQPRTVRGHTPRPILIATAIYVVLLVLTGVKMWTWNSDAFWFFPVSAAFLPSIIYSISIFVYGSALFGSNGSAQRTRAWLNLLWITVLPYATLLAIEVVSLRAGETKKQPYWYYCIASGVTVLLLALWGYIGGTVVVRETSSHWRQNSALELKLALSLLAGGVTMLVGGVMILREVDFAPTDWSHAVLEATKAGGGITRLMAIDDALRSMLLQVGFGAGIAIALFAVIAGIMAPLRRPHSQKGITIPLNVCITISWYILTVLYYIPFYLFATFGPLFGVSGGSKQLELAIAIAFWLMVGLGVALWFKYRDRADDRGRIVRTVLVLWHLPLVPISIAILGLMPLVERWAYGPILYFAGLQTVTVCWWKMWSLRSTIVRDQVISTEDAAGSRITGDQNA